MKLIEISMNDNTVHQEIISSFNELEKLDKITNQLDFEIENRFQKNMYLKIIPELSKRLNNIHNQSYPDKYWEQIIGLEILMHINHCRDIFKKIRDKKYKIKIIKPKNYYIPKNSSDYRLFTQHRDFGYAQLLSIYECEYNNNLIFCDTVYDNNINKKKYLNFFSLIKKILTKKTEIIFILVRRILSFFLKHMIKPRLLLVQTIFTNLYYIKLMILSLGKIQILNDLELKDDRSHERIDLISRKKMSKTDSNFNDFEKFFFLTLFHFTPKSWIESYRFKYSKNKNILKKYSNINYVVSESSSEEARFFVANASNVGIKFLYNEHNFLQQFILGNIIWFHLRNCDKFLSLGWSSISSKKVIPLGSLYQWSTKKKKEKIEILFISSVASKKFPLYSAAYGEQGYSKALSYFDMNIKFFANLENSIISKIYFRGHPHVKKKLYSSYVIDDNLYLNKYLNEFSNVDYSSHNSAVNLISQSKLVIINYLSTPWLQSLVSNVPTIILLNKDAYYVDQNYISFFDLLIKNNVIFTSAASAAQFVNSISDNPNIWWKSKNVQDARSKFLESNFMVKQQLSKFLVKLSSEIE